ncbi:unnamed protein product, partial [marine sediment metagenome]
MKRIPEDQRNRMAQLLIEGKKPREVVKIMISEG